MKTKLVGLYWFLSNQIGFDILLCFRAVRSLPRFVSNFFQFRSQYRGKIKLKPCLHDWYEQAGSVSNEYAIQDLYVAQLIHKEKPRRHLDVGSRLDGFVANVASFREIEVLDVRQLNSTNDSIKFRSVDLTDLNAVRAQNIGCFDSLSCLHALEHFGLGRYGDALTADGWKLGLLSFSELLEPAGLLYVSTPVGVERVDFNANWVFDPRSIISVAREHGLELTNLIVIKSGLEPEAVDASDETLDMLAAQEYTLCLFMFMKR